MDRRRFAGTPATREALGWFATLALIVAGAVFLSVVSSASPAQPAVRMQAQNVLPAVAKAKPAPRKAKTRKRVRLTRLPALARVNDPKTLGFQWPVTGGHQITSPFGKRDDGLHHGADIGCAIGQPLYASRAGRVIGVGDAGRAFGLAVMIDHGSSYQTLYTHLSKLDVRHGQYLRTREYIGRCGDTGNASGPHVHFEMRYGGYVWDPLRFLP